MSHLVLTCALGENVCGSELEVTGGRLDLWIKSPDRRKAIIVEYKAVLPDDRDPVPFANEGLRQIIANRYFDDAFFQEANSIDLLGAAFKRSTVDGRKHYVIADHYPHQLVSR